MIPTVRIGSRGTAVVVLQQSLNELLTPAPKLKLDGSFGPRLADAAKRFQSARGLQPDGVAGPKTWSALGLDTTIYHSGFDASPIWMQIAAAEATLGVKRLPSHHERHIVEYLHTTTNIAVSAQNTDSTAWCSAFVNWCLHQGGKQGTNHALASSWLDWGLALPTPRPGAITVLRHLKGGDKFAGTTTGHHVGFLISGSAGAVRILGGNQGSAVKESTFHINLPSSKELAGWVVEGYRWPN